MVLREAPALPTCIGEGNGNPLQYPCLENPWDGGAWWAAVYGSTTKLSIHFPGMSPVNRR